MSSQSHGRTRFECANPILRVTSMTKSVQYYTEALGFSNAPWGTDAFTCVSRDEASIYLSEGDQGQPGTWVWVGVEDVKQLHVELLARGADIIGPPQPFAWAWEMKVKDPDGHVLRFGSDPG